MIMKLVVSKTPYREQSEQGHYTLVQIYRSF